jgi:hypothetical protein
VFVPLEAVTDPWLVLAAVGRAAGADLAGTGAPMEALTFGDGVASSHSSRQVSSSASGSAATASAAAWATSTDTGSDQCMSSSTMSSGWRAAAAATVSTMAAATSSRSDGPAATRSSRHGNSRPMAGQRTAPRPQRRHARCRAHAAGHLHPSLLSLTDQPVGEHGFAHPGFAKQQHSPAIASPSARQRGGKLGLLTVAADDRHVGGQVHAHTQPHALLTAGVWQCPAGPLTCLPSHDPTAVSVATRAARRR